MTKLATFLILGWTGLTQYMTNESFAGPEVGNGGDAIVCRGPKGEILSVEFFDLYEARTLRKIKPSWKDETASVEAKVLTALERIGTFSPKRSETYFSYFGSFLTDTRFLRGVRLEDIADSEHIFVPADCAIEQAAIQAKIRFEEDPRYVINEDLWQMMDTDSRASLILHEIIYREAILAGHKNSISVRYYNSLILSDRISQMSEIQYKQVMERIQLPEDASDLYVLFSPKADR